MAESRSERVTKAVKDIRFLYAKGQRLPPRKSSAETYGSGELATAAKKVGLTTEVARMARQFADPRAGYTADQVEEFCEMIEDTQPGQPESYAVIGRTHIYRLITVTPTYYLNLCSSSKAGEATKGADLARVLSGLRRGLDLTDWLENEGLDVICEMNYGAPAGTPGRFMGHFVEQKGPL